MISLEAFNKHQLQALITSNRFEAFPYLPITIHRAIAHIHNPRADDEVPLLILAFENHQLAGYIGILPDYIFHIEQKINVGWLSTLFVHPDFRGKKIAQQLLIEASEQYRGNILMTEFTQQAETIYVKSKLFIYQKPLVGMSYHYLSNLQKILPAKNKRWSNYSLIFKTFDYCINIGVKFARKMRNTNAQEFKISNEIDVEIADFVKNNIQKNSFNRGIQEIEWIVSYPWIIEGIDALKKPYQFSDFDNRFGYVFIKIFKEDILQTVLVLSIRNSTAKLCFVIGERNPLLCSNAISQLVVSNSISNLISFEEDINEYLNKTPALFKKKRERKFLMHKQLFNLLGNDYNFSVGAGDGDSIFT